MQSSPTPLTPPPSNAEQAPKPSHEPAGTQPALDAVCQYLSGLADEPCHPAAVLRATSSRMELGCDYRFETGALLAVELIDRASGRVLPTRFVKVKEASEDAALGWRLQCVSVERSIRRRRARGSQIRARKPQDSGRAGGPRLARRATPCPFPFRRAVYAALGWAAFLVLLLYLANARGIQQGAGLWTPSHIRFLLCFGCAFGLGSATLGWALERATRWAERFLGIV